MGLTFGWRAVWSSLRRTVAFLIASAQVEARTRFERKALGYCRECRKKVQIRNPKRITLKHNCPAARDLCPKCGTRVFLIGGI